MLPTLTPSCVAGCCRHRCGTAACRLVLSFVHSLCILSFSFVPKVDELKGLRRNMLVGITKDMQKQVTQVLDLKEMVVGEMLRDRSLMVSLFQRCGKAEFKFLVNRYVED